MTESGWERIRSIFRSTPRAEATDEIAFHMQMRERELIEQGVDPARARALAEERFGPVTPIERELIGSTKRRRHRADRAESWNNIGQDVRYAIRSLRKSPAFTLTSMLTLALGVAATLAVFTVVSGVLLRPLPYEDPARIQMIWIGAPNASGGVDELPLSSGFYSDIERESRTFTAMAAFRSWPFALADSTGDGAEPVSGARVTPALFRVLGVSPAMGQSFSEESARPGGPAVAIISHDLWQRRFGGDRSIVGKSIQLSQQPFAVVGVMPDGFAFPRGAELPAPLRFGLRTDVWTPLVFDSTDMRNYGTQNLSAVGRLAASATQAGAQAELSGIMRRFLDANAPTLKLSFQLSSASEQAASKVRRALLILLGAVTLVLIIAAANVGSLLVARIGGRQRELAVRAALGAGRGRIARQLVTENLVLAASGTSIGAALSFWVTKVMLALVPGAMPRADDVTLDWRVLSVAAAVAIVAGTLFGIAAAFSVRWGKLASTLHSGDTRSAGSVSRRSGRRVLVAAEVALSLMLLIGAALLTRSFIALSRVAPGFDARNTLTAHVGVPVAGRFRPLVDGPRWSTLLNEVTARVGGLPGVVAAGAVSSLPLSGGWEGGGIRVPGVTYETGQGPTAQYNIVSGEYFKAAGITVLAGRAFDRADDAPTALPGIVVSRELATRLFDSVQFAIGRELNTTFEFTRNRPPRTIIGVVENVKQSSLEDEPSSQVYLPQSQMSYPGLALVVRTEGNPTALVDAVKREIRVVDRTLTVNNVQSMESVVSSSLARQRFSMTLIGVFAGLAVALAIVGLYGVIALLVGQRRREIGVRLALGASQTDVVRMILGEGARVTVLGVLLGIAGAMALTRVMSSMLYGVSTTDVWTFAGAALLVAAVALGASYAPARRAARVDPKAALIAE